MSSQARWKLLAVLIVASALMGAVGWQQFAPRPAPSTIITVTPAATTVTESQTAVVPVRQTEWIQIRQVKPINYYLSLLESNGTQPYFQLASELRKLPDLTNATAVAKITFLALNASSHEVREAFELMIKGGTPDPRDFQRVVPSYNTELQVLYWLATRNEFKTDDTLVLAIAIVNGFWITIGNQQVRQAVKKDTSDLLGFFRETCELQNRHGYPLLEEYPLEAKICLAWSANHAPDFWSDTFSLARFKGSIELDLASYEWATISIQTLRQMRDYLDRNLWIGRDYGDTVSKMEEHLYFSNHWNYTYTTYLTIDGRHVRAVSIHNVDWQFQYYLRTGKGIGTCGDEADLMDGFCKAWGIATTFVWRRPSQGTRDYRISNSHMYAVYYNPRTRSWQAYRKQAQAINLKENYTLYIFRPPVLQQKYLHSWDDPSIKTVWYANMYYIAGTPYSGQKIASMFTDGLPTSQMKQWLLYS